MNEIKNPFVPTAIQSGNLENYYECLAPHELSWLHAHIGTTIAGYEKLEEPERGLVEQLAMPMWLLIVPTLEQAMRRHCVGFTAIASAQVILREDDLKCCPFCGESPNVNSFESTTEGLFESDVTCHVCAATINGWGYTTEEAEQSAMRNWNRRP